jgi:glycosyltransferase involved in cell wall biosynthesis
LKEVLYISYDGMTDPLGMSQVLPYLTGLSEFYKIHLVSFEKPDAFTKKEKEIRNLTKAHGITWYPQIYHKSPPVLSTLWDIRKMFTVSEELCKARKIKIVHCRSYISALAGLYLKKKLGVKFIFDMRGFWADERVEGNIWDLKNPLYRWIYKFFKKKETQFIQQSDAIVSLTYKGKDIITEQHGESINQKITVIPCCVDLEHFNKKNISEARKDEFRKSLGISGNDKVVSYIGSLGTWYMSKEMVDFFSISLNKDIFNKLLVISKDDPSALMEHARNIGVPDDRIIIRPADRNELPDLIDLCEWSLFFIRPSYSKSASSPTKLGEILAMNKPVISNKGIGDTDKIFSQYECGILVDDFSKKSYEAALERLKAYPSKDNTAAAKSYFSLSEGVGSYRRIYEDLLR